MMDSKLNFREEREGNMDIDNLIERLMNLTYKYKSDYDFNVIDSSNEYLVFNEIKKWADEQNMGQEIAENRIRLAELEAKVFAYESIISNSNFAPILESRKGEEE